MRLVKRIRLALGGQNKRRAHCGHSKRAAAVAADIVVGKKSGAQRCGWLLHTTLLLLLAPNLLLELDAALGRGVRASLET